MPLQLIIADTLIVDFALTEAAYTVVRILQEFPSVKLSDDETVELPGTEKQAINFTMSIGEGCKVSIA